ncbi:MAG: DUF3575 domain-containing protein [Flavobacteriaceae bacterium]
MKKLFLLFLFLSAITYSQEEPIQKKHEFKLNYENSKEYFGSTLGISYERLFSKKNTYGFEVQKGIGYSDEDIRRDFSLTGFYRRYFSKNQNGFFTEGFIMYAGYDSKNNVTEPNRLFIGLALGVKFVIENIITIDYHLGGGMDILNYVNSDIEFALRTGLSLGFRF